MKIGGLVTNYEAWDLTFRSLQGFLNHCSESIVRVVVVDDCSISKPVDDPIWDHPLIKIQKNERNIGYVASVNRGFKSLCDCDIVILLDCDSHLLMSPIFEIERNFQEDDKLGALAMCEDTPAGQRIAGEEEPILIEFILGQKYQRVLSRCFSKKNRRFIAHSCSLVVRRQAFESVGGFDETFDFLDADVDFSLRILDAGWLIKPATNLRCYHQGSGSPQSSRKRAARFHANRYRLLRKHKVIRYEFPVKIGLALRHILECLSLIILFAIWPASRTSGNLDKIAGRLQLLRSVWNGYQIKS